MQPEGGEPVAERLAAGPIPARARPADPTDSAPDRQGMAGGDAVGMTGAAIRTDWIPAAPDEQVADEDIVRRCLAGDRDAYGVLVQRYQGRIVGYVQRMVRDREQALDIAQEAFLKAWVHLARYDSQWRFSTWIYSIASNAAIDHLRRRKKRMVSLDEPIRMGDSEMQRELPGPDRTAADDLEGKELAERLEAAIAELPFEYRQLLLLRHPGGRSYEEIAEITKLPMGTVKNRIFRARQRLKDRLGSLLPADL
jgi:RNA polymerase sigma-70 factor (ECF subfamily)